MKKFYITTPIYYVNDSPHIGHAYTTVAADALARSRRLAGEPVFFLTGTDEHGSKISQAAEKKGDSPQHYVDQLSAEFKKLWQTLNISHDDFIRTTEPRHVAGVQNLFEKLFRQGEIYKGFYEDWYCVACESFWLESEVAGGRCPDCGRAVEKLKEESYFFRLSKYEKALLEHYESRPEFLSPPQRAQEIKNFVKGGLKDLSVSRLKEKWGIPLPFDPGHTVYVWFDALLNYVTAAPPELWPADVHLVGKEIFRFHAVIWPAMLLALGLPLPERVFAHGWWTVEGEKMSKSRGNVVDPNAVVRDYGTDGFRYFLLREIPFGADGDFSQSALRTRYNTELANDLGNLLSRTLTLVEKNFGGVLEARPEGALLPAMEEQKEKIPRAFARLAFGEALDGLFAVVSEANRYLDRRAPWALVKSDREGAARVLAESLSVLRWLAPGFYPFMPESMEKMWRQLGEAEPLIAAGARAFREPGAKLPKRQVRKEGVLFPRKS